MKDLNLIGERSSTLVAGCFGSAVHADTLADEMRRDPRLKGSVTIVFPGDKHVERKLEPENNGIWNTLVRSHLILGALGVGTGLLLAIWVMVLWPAAQSSPGFTLFFLGSMGLFLGLMAGGVVTLRPDHGWVNDRVRIWLAQGRVAVIAHPIDEDAARRAFSVLSAAGGRPVRSI